MAEQDRWILKGWTGFALLLVGVWFAMPKPHASNPLLLAPVYAASSEPADEPEPALAMSEVDREALILNAFNEARGEGRAGILAVLGVTMARVESQCYPDSVHDVVFQRKQFSWTAQRAAPRTLARAARVDADALEYVEDIVDEFIAEGAKPNNSLLYHADYVSPAWAKSRKVKKVKTVGNHLFYDIRHC
jgi:N-acetylmuramoyl-L-alanine amidase